MEAAIAQRMPTFHRYRNQSGHSGVVAYAVLTDGILVEFTDGRVYLYSHDCPGRRHVSRMKVIAREGRGLGTYISRHVGNRFAARISEPASATQPFARAKKAPPEGGAKSAW